MLSLHTFGGVFNSQLLEIVGLSTDAKPVEYFDTKYIVNGSYFYEMDTKKMYMYDEKNKAWLPQN